MRKLTISTCLMLLACKDQRDQPAVRPSIPSQVPGWSPRMSWNVKKEINPLDSSVALGLGLAEIDRGKQRTPWLLTISCKNGDSDVYVLTMGRADDEPLVRYRIDSDSIVSAKWIGGDVGLGVMGANSLVKQLVGAKRFAFEVLNPNSTAEFDVSKLREHLSDMRVSCPNGALPPA